ncbi:MAG: (Fe-S)-binding protein, partial [Desulfarculus sp.]|nr:(Fe-S)-binding protein [Pseudomonadota bacterium]MBV1751064.1 (Fe-S)-binding protein [Desulfarculus sp.]
LTKEFDLEIETFYLWELLSEAIIIEPWSEDEVEKAHAESAEQWERLGVELEDEDEWTPPE